MYAVILSETFQKQYSKLDKPLRERVKKLLKQLETELLGLPLKNNLSGFYSVHFTGNKYRLIYHKDANCIEILVVAVGRRDDHFYNKLSKAV